MISRRARAIETLGAVLLLWIGARVGLSALQDDTSPLVGEKMPGFINISPMAAPVTAMPKDVAWPTMAAIAVTRPPDSRRSAHQQEPRPVAVFGSPGTKTAQAPSPNSHHEEADAVIDAAPPLPPQARSAHFPKLSGSAWLLARTGTGTIGSAPQGQLGASQAGLRLLVSIPAPIPKSLRLSLRATTALETNSGREIAPGLSWKPLTALPVEVIVERRIRLARNECDALAVLVAGGVSDVRLDERAIFDAYAQTGIVGATRRLKFADGAATVRTEVSPHIRAGVGVWGGAQPSLSRIDVGPSVRLRISGASLSADWRFRVAGNARPGSGPSITIARDF